jgi:predicted nucleic acid-binding protein
MKVFVDTNILVDLVCNRKDFIESAKRLFLLGYLHKIDLIISPLSYINTFYIGKRYKYPEGELRFVLSKINSFTITSGFVEQTISQALSSDWNDIEDASQFYSAKEAGADVILTRNKKDFDKSTIPVYEPREFLDANQY